MEFFLKHQKVIMRSVGAFLLVVGFVINFWVTPQKAVSANALAQANLERMEASVQGSSGGRQAVKKPDTSHISKALKATREKQIKYMTIIAMALGALFLGYSFIKKEE
ncbi:hypothetical protein [Sulfurimonas paralvinellae]|uniref:Uncharacterized protein n=1 Tax=Sulfurimonas paralvinellae TaxID=317658 RepID=A0A7M1B5M3_9BACT|nr:hypothetical protein [Sulfurimonas paralvinellae]QOP45011.1 hypothetical protein FM071_01340 [Sulfurimonas paralvinellae]